MIFANVFHHINQQQRYVCKDETEILFSIRIRTTFYKVDSKQIRSSNNSMQSNSFFSDNRKMTRARDDGCCEFRIMHQIKFQSLIRCHHVYKDVWSPYNGETQIAQPDNRDEA